MKRLFIKILLFSFLIFIIGITLSLFLPRNTYWGNKEYVWKINEYKKDQYNTVLFGSSRIYRGINPLVFDSLVNLKATSPIKTFNLASHASWSSETFYLYDAFLNDTTLSNGVHLALMEFQNIMSIRPGKLGDEKSIYYQNLDHYWFILKYNFHEVLRNPKKIITSVYSIGVYSLSTFLNVTNVKQINTKKDTSPPLDVESINERGYLGFKELSELNVTDQNIQSLTDNIRQFKNTGTDRYNPTFYKKVMELIERSNQQGIQLIFVLPPVRLTEGMMAVYNAIPDENKIAVCDPDEHEQLYRKENWIDPIHINKIGAQYFTLSVGKQCLDKTKL